MKALLLLCLPSLSLTAVSTDTLFFAFAGKGKDSRLSAWDAVACTTFLSPDKGCPEPFLAIDSQGDSLYAATRSNVYVLPYPPLSRTCGLPVLPVDLQRNLSVARVGQDGYLYFSDVRLEGGGVFRAPLPSSYPPPSPLPSVQPVVLDGSDSVTGPRYSLAVTASHLFYGYQNFTLVNGTQQHAGTGILQLRLQDSSLVSLVSYPLAQRWVPIDLNVATPYPAGSAYSALWFAEWRYSSPGQGSTCLQLVNFSLPSTVDVDALQTNPVGGPLGGSVAVDVAAAAAFFAITQSTSLSLVSALSRDLPPQNFDFLDFAAMDWGYISDVTFAPAPSGQGCRLPYAAYGSASAPTVCDTPLPGCGAPRSATPTVSVTPSPGSGGGGAASGSSPPPLGLGPGIAIGMVVGAVAAAAGAGAYLLWGRWKRANAWRSNFSQALAANKRAGEALASRAPAFRSRGSEEDSKESDSLTANSQ